MSSKKRRWRDLTARQKVTIIVVSSLQLALLVAAQIDIRRRAATKINGEKRLWRALTFVNGIGPIAYFVFGRKRQCLEAPTQEAG